MDRFHRITASLAAAALALAIPASSLALGLGLGVQSQSNSEISAGSAGIGASTSADAKVEARCQHLSGNDRLLCEASVRAYIDARANAKDARTNVRTVIKDIRDRLHDAREDGRALLARVRMFLSGLRAQLNSALNSEAELALKVCKDREGDEHDQCVADAKVKLQAKVNAAVEAMKK